jgi:hypothetical protein
MTPATVCGPVAFGAEMIRRALAIIESKPIIIGFQKSVMTFRFLGREMV